MRGPGPDGVTHRCTQPIRCVQPTLFMQGLVNSLRMLPGPQVLTAWSRLTSGGSPLTGGDGLTLYARAVVEIHPHGARIQSWPWALPRDSIPPVLSPGTCYAAWRRGAVSYLTPEVDAFRSGGDFPVWTNFLVWTPPTPNRTGTTGTRCVHSARFPKMTRRVVQKNPKCPVG